MPGRKIMDAIFLPGIFLSEYIIESSRRRRRAQSTYGLPPLWLTAPMAYRNG
jgi:hypothetical protein